jgi:hypothetical protein
VVEPVNPGIVVLTCAHCDTLLYREADVLRAGTQSVVGEPRGPVALGAKGQVEGQQSEVLGRVRLSYDGGLWDEWYLGEGPTGSRWLVEDEKRYSLERAIDMPRGAHEGMALGDQLVVSHRNYEVREVGDAVVEGVEGQVPKKVEPGQVFRYVDLAELGGSGKLLLEFPPDGPGHAFAGRVVGLGSVRLYGGHQRAVVERVEAPSADSIHCGQCGAPYSPPTKGEPPQTASCSFCDAVLHLDGAQARVVGHRPRTPAFDLEIGDSGLLLGVRWEVMGRTTWIDGEGYRSDEFLLWSEEQGYLWLEKDNGHYAYTKPAVQAPSIREIRTRSLGDRCTFDGRSLKLLAKGPARLSYVDGALPWLANVGDTYRFYDFAAAPHVASVELGETEMEAFVGQWLDGYAVLSAFKRSSRHRSSSDVHIGQPNPFRRYQVPGFVLFALGIVNLVLAGSAPLGGREVARFTIPASATSESEAEESDSFVIDESMGAVTTVTYSTHVDNSWVWVDLSLLDDESELEVGYTGQEVEYYHGYEGGESWTEGNKTGQHSLLTPPPGTYFLEGELEYDIDTPVDVTVVVGGRLARYNLVLGLLFVVAGVMPVLLGSWFEKRRLEDA